MKKKFLSVVLSAVALAALTLALASCFQPVETAYIKPVKEIGFAQVHGGYLGVCEIIVDGEEDIIDLRFDEIFYPHTWAISGTHLKVANFTDTVTIGEGTSAKTYAKYIKIGDKFFQLKNNELVYFEINADKQAVTSGITDLEAALKDNAEVQQWYYEQARLRNSFKIMKDGETGLVEEALGINNSNGGLFKSNSTYWTANPGWRGNIDAIIKHYMEEGVISMDTINELTNPETGKALDNKTLKDLELISGATLGSDFPQYLKLITTTYNKAVDKIQAQKTEANE